MRRVLVLLTAIVLAPCVPFLEEEEEDPGCWSDDECGEGRICIGARSPGCGGGEKGSCMRLRTDGESCNVDGVISSRVCVPDLVCHEFLGWECQPPSPAGGPCASSDDCDLDADRLASDDDEVCDRTSSTCTQAGRVSIGHGCDTSRACAVPAGCRDGFCRPPGAEGDRCEPYGISSPERPACVEGLHCHRDAEVCTPFLAEGDGCVPADRCAEPLYCHLERHVCSRIRTGGDTCTTGDRCEVGFFCSPSRGACIEPLAAGETCVRGDDCAGTLYCSPSRGVCLAAVGAGDPCDGERCPSGFVCKGEPRTCQVP